MHMNLVFYKAIIILYKHVTDTMEAELEFQPTSIERR